jgi:hypothetical protein
VAPDDARRRARASEEEKEGIAALGLHTRPLSSPVRVSLPWYVRFLRPRSRSPLTFGPLFSVTVSHGEVAYPKTNTLLVSNTRNSLCKGMCPPGLSEHPDSRVHIQVIAGIVHEGPHFLISLFLPPYMLFLAFFLTKLESTTLI